MTSSCPFSLWAKQPMVLVLIPFLHGNCLKDHHQKGAPRKSYPTGVPLTSRHMAFFILLASWERMEELGAAAQGEEKTAWLQSHWPPEAWISSQNNSWGMLPPLRPGSVPALLKGKVTGRATQVGTTRIASPKPIKCTHLTEPNFRKQLQNGRDYTSTIHSLSSLTPTCTPIL